MTRIAEMRAERLAGLTESAIREGQKAAEYEAIADIVEAHRSGEVAAEVVALMRKNAEHHRGWGDKWVRDAEALRAQYERTEPSPVGARPTAGDLRRYRETHVS